MSIQGELQALIERTNRDFDDWSDFFEHTKSVWRSFLLGVDEGHKFKAINAATGKEFTEADLISLSQFYIEHLASFALQRHVSVFESFIFGFLRLLLLRNPGVIGDKEIKLHRIISKTSIVAVVEELVDHELNERRYEKPKEWFEFINRVERLGCPSEDEINTISEMKAGRDVLEHNSGVVNNTYLLKSGGKARFKEGDYIEIPDAYLRASWDLLKKVCNELVNAAIKVLPKE